MADKRFWSGAILLVTIVVAGASSLPPLLLRPAAVEAVPITPVSVAKIDVPPPARAEAELLPKAEPVLPPPSLSIAAAQPVAASVVEAAAPQAVVAAEPVPREREREAAPIVFPPVQSIGIPASELAAPVRADTEIRPREKAARPERHAEHAAKPKRNAVRPAPYPIREFFYAWRR